MDSDQEDSFSSSRYSAVNRRKDGDRKKSFLFGKSNDRFTSDFQSEFLPRRREFIESTSTTARPMTAANIDSIPTLPDLESMETTIEAETSADAPVMAVNKLFSYQDLEKDIAKFSALSSLDASEVSTLLKKILCESDVREEPGVWTWDNLIASVASKLNDSLQITQDSGQAREPSE